MPRSLITLLLAVPIWVAAQTTSPPAFEMDCAGAGPEAVTTVPPPMDRHAEVQCTIYGHMIKGVRGTAWLPPGSQYPVMISAQLIVNQPQVVKHAMHFRRITAETHRGREAAAIFGAYAKFLLSPEDAPQVLELRAVSNEGVEQKVYLFETGPGSLWGYACEPVCNPDRPFMVTVQ